MASNESCTEVSGRVAPVVDRNRCEGKEDCVRVCPFNVFEIGTLNDAQRRELTFCRTTQSLGARRKTGVRGQSARLSCVPTVRRRVP